MSRSETLGPVDALDRIAFLMERQLAPTYRVQAYRKACWTIAGLEPGELEDRIQNDSLRSIKNIGESTEAVIKQAARGDVPDKLASLEQEKWPTDDPSDEALELRASITGDCHTHSDWSDGGSPIIEMARTARSLGHEYIVLTDHSPRLTVANGLTVERLQEQLGVVAAINEEWSDFEIRTGIEVDINEDGTLDQVAEMLDQLDMVVASVHSKLRSDSPAMTDRMLKAVQKRHTNILGHCTGRMVMGSRKRPQSSFDARKVFQACIDTGTAIEINCRPERQDPPEDLMKMALDMGAMFAIDTDAHAPGQLDWQILGCIRAATVGITKDRVINCS